MSKFKGGLGKGLSALIRPTLQPDESVHIPEQPPAEPRLGGSINDIELSRIRANPLQPRADFDQQALDELKDSIRQKGIIQPVTVRMVEDGNYELISGERRVRASIDIGLTTIPAYVVDVRTDAEMLELALVENLQREHLNPIEIAISYQRLMQDVGLSVEEIAVKVSKDRTTVTNSLRLLRLPPEVQQSVRKAQISPGHARALVALPDETTQLRLFQKIVKNELNVRQVEKLVREIGKKAEIKKGFHVPAGTTSAIQNIEEKMQQILGTKVKVALREGGHGAILIEFYSNDDLGRIFDLLASIKL